MSKDEPRKSLPDRFLDQLRTSHLLMLLTGLLVLDMAIPDPILFIDEIVLGVATLLVARWKMRSSAPQPPVAGAAGKPPTKNVTPPDEHEASR